MSSRSRSTRGTITLSGYFFRVTAGGAVAGAVATQGGDDVSLDLTWDAVWEAKTLDRRRGMDRGNPHSRFPRFPITAAPIPCGESRSSGFDGTSSSRTSSPSRRNAKCAGSRPTVISLGSASCRHPAGWSCCRMCRREGSTGPSTGQPVSQRKRLLHGRGARPQVPPDEQRDGQRDLQSRTLDRWRWIRRS